jgi:hypothetical protein
MKSYTVMYPRDWARYQVRVALKERRITKPLYGQREGCTNRCMDALNDDGVFWVTRSKESLSFRVVKKLAKAADRGILRDELVVLKNKRLPCQLS